MKPKRVNRNKKPQIVKGSTWTSTDGSELTDVDGDGASDLVLTHLAKRDGEAFCKIEVTWYGIDPVVADAFAASYEDIRGDDKPIRGFGQMVKHWKGLGKKAEKIFDAGTLMAEGIGEADDGDDE